ncbi:MAG: hypothetical protein GTO18_08140 [Anaerolineales bacterium]|nr:hypothetical protein [Anaerolineales bacterium]
MSCVNSPNLSSSVDTVLYMYYGNPQAPNQQNVTGTWDADFMGVLHLNNDPSASAPQMKDSTAKSSDGTTSGNMTSSDQVSGKIGIALELDGTNDHITGKIAGSPPAEYTLQAWIKRSTTAYPEDHIVELYRMQFFVESNDKLEAGTSREFDINGPNSISANTWYHAVYVQTASG